MKQESADDLTIYLLHFSEPVGRARHYLGITKTKRLQQRLRQHTRSFGAKLTERARRQGASIYLATTWDHQTYADERRFKWNSHFDRLCPLCQDPTGDWLAQALPVRPIADPQKSTLPLLAWSSAKRSA